MLRRRTLRASLAACGTILGLFRRITGRQSIRNCTRFCKLLGTTIVTISTPTAVSSGRINRPPPCFLLRTCLPGLSWIARLGPSTPNRGLNKSPDSHSSPGSPSPAGSPQPQHQLLPGRERRQGWGRKGGVLPRPGGGWGSQPLSTGAAWLETTHSWAPN